MKCYELVRELIKGIDLESRVAAYEKLSTHVLAGYGQPIREGQTAVMLASGVDEAGVEAMLDYWDGLFGG